MVRNEVPKLVHSYPKKLPLSAQFGIIKKSHGYLESFAMSDVCISFTSIHCDHIRV